MYDKDMSCGMRGGRGGHMGRGGRGGRGGWGFWAMMAGGAEQGGADGQGWGFGGRGGRGGRGGHGGHRGGGWFHGGHRGGWGGMMGMGGAEHGEHGGRQQRTVTLVSSEYVSPESKLMKFSLPKGSENEVFSAEVETTIKLVAQIGGRQEMRLYSPVSSTKQRGSFDLIVKLFGAGGMSEHLHNMKPGDTIEMLGPRVKFPVKANQYKRVGMVAGGVGITSVFQVAQEMLTNEADKTEVTLVHVARHEEDLLVLREKVKEMEEQSNGRFHVHYVLSQPAEGWTGLTGHVTTDVLKQTMPKPAQGTMIMVCGPDSLCEAICGKSHHGSPLTEVKGMLKELGYTPDQVHCF